MGACLFPMVSHHLLGNFQNVAQALPGCLFNLYKAFHQTRLANGVGQRSRWFNTGLIELPRLLD
jgi:hypothetical protein